MTSKLLMFVSVSIAIVGGANSCNQYKTKPMSKQDSVNIRLAVGHDKLLRRIDSLEIRYNSVRSDLDTLYKMAYKGQNKAEDLGRWQRRGERAKAFRKGFLGM